MADETKPNSDQPMNNSNQQNASLIMPHETQSESAPNPSLFNDDFTPQEAREALEEQSEVKTEPLITEEDIEKKVSSPIFWLVGILSVLAIIVLVIWLVA